MRLFHISYSLLFGCLLTAVSLTFLSSPLAVAGGETYCVVPPGTPTGPFAPCSQTFTSIQSAVDAASEGGEIWIAGGTYTEVLTRMGVEQVVYLNKTVTLRGGYVPPFADPPDHTTNPTILDANQLGRVLYIYGPISPTIEGLHMTHGLATADNNKGGGVYIVGATALLRHNVIYNNWAGYGNSGYGGGLTAESSRLTLDNNLFLTNTATIMTDPTFIVGGGGGVFLSQSEITVTNNTIAGNTAVSSTLSSQDIGLGGGLTLWNCNGIIADNRIENNLAAEFGEGATHWGGGVFMELGAGNILTLSRNLVQDNISTVSGEAGHGGGIAILAPYGTTVSQTQISLIENTIAGNTAVISGSIGLGGGVAIFLNSPDVLNFTRNVIISNTAAITADVSYGGGIVIAWDNLTFFRENLIQGNIATAEENRLGAWGGGVALYDSQAWFSGDVIRGNRTSTTGPGLGGGLYLHNSYTTLTNTVFLQNQATTAGAGLTAAYSSTLNASHATITNHAGGDASSIYVTNASGELPTSYAPSHAFLTNTILADHAVGIEVVGGSDVIVDGMLWYNLSDPVSATLDSIVIINNLFFGDPFFAPDGYHLLSDSAALNRGVTSNVILDIDHEPRLLPDLGADELWNYKVYLPIMQK